ncbi:SWIM zinc finger family protein [Spirulina major]|uniref:SWIM zinc finger family protein n=1 Tax=Spirulina major TaxID=270636 RepID=UPI000933F92F|nr:SWIM zinc finger family protein [Spirulina major]
MTYELENREWWVERWLELLDSYRFKKRLERARRYSTEGNVISIDFQGARVVAHVQGSDEEPYVVSLSLNPFSNEDWRYVISTMSQKSLYSAQLLAGDMPAEIEEVFTANGLSLFPFTLSEIHSRCTCPDKANPCKHIGAVYYQLGDRFSEDPFVLFQLRGRTKAQILDALRQLRGKGNRKSRNPKKGGTKPGTVPLVMKQFWVYDEPLDPSLVAIAPAPDQQTVLDRLGPIPLPTAEAQDLHRTLAEAYNQICQNAIALALNRD